MPQASKTFRIFVSSTFSDLKAERNALQEHVFPRLRELCAQHGCMFQAIDLRWGIRNEAALDQQTMMICLEEIARCQKVTPRPNFIVLLGDRYGWRPLPAETPAAEFEEILDGIESRIDLNLLKRWYRRDDNAVPAAYLLQPRDGEYESPSKWESIEHQLRTILLDGIEKVALLETETLKYIRSATEQEIISGLFNVPDAHQHVFCFFRKIIDFEHLSALGDIGRDFCDSFEPHGPGHGYLLDLKRRLRRKLGRNIHEYDAEWSKGRLSQAHIGTLPASLDECLNLNTDGRRSPSLCEDVWRQLSRVILDEIARLKDQDALESEASEHAAFGAERTKHFVGREDFLQKATGYLGGASGEPLVVFGASGSGKSAFMARAASDARRRFPNAVVVTRFIGATPASSDGQALLAGVCQEISRRVEPGAGETSVDLENLSEELLKRLSLATRDKPIIVFLDALDQLSSAYNARSLRWLPSSLPAGARVVISTTPGDCLTALEKKVSRDSLTELQPMSLDDGGKLLDRWLKDAGRTLQPGQRQDVLEGFARNGLPLYLKLAFE
ncbi:MAG: AAA family ATPase [Blastocatellia bacterium]